MEDPQWVSATKTDLSWQCPRFTVDFKSTTRLNRFHGVLKSVRRSVLAARVYLALVFSIELVSFQEGALSFLGRE